MLPPKSLVGDRCFAKRAAIVLFEPLLAALRMELVGRVARQFDYINTSYEVFHTDWTLNFAVLLVHCELCGCEALHHVRSEACPLRALGSANVVAEARGADRNTASYE